MPDDEVPQVEQNAPTPLTPAELRARRAWACCTWCLHRDCDVACDCPCHDPYGIDRAA
jgi:hypothetical protein